MSFLLMKRFLTLPVPRAPSSSLYKSPCLSFIMGFPGGSDNKQSACNAGDPGLIPGWGRSHGEGNGYPFQYSCLENPRNNMKMQKNMTPKDELPWLVGAQ